MAKVPCEDHLASMSDKLVFCRAVLNQTLISLYVLDLDCLSEPLLLILFKSFRLQKLKNIQSLARLVRVSLEKLPGFLFDFFGDSRVATEMNTLQRFGPLNRWQDVKDCRLAEVRSG